MNSNRLIDSPKVGLVTFHDFNYGSALQCFATQVYLKSKGYKSEVIERKPQKYKIIGYLYTAWNLFSLCALNPCSTRTILSIFRSERREALRITEKSELSICEFNESFLNVVEYSYAELKRKAKRDEFAFFLSGSDQVWKAFRINLYNLYFLRFAPQAKRVSWAASFGGDVIAPYNTKRYAKYIKDYKAISVREPSAVDLVKKFVGLDVKCLADPVILLNGSEWRELYKKNSRKMDIAENYIFYFFLDKPSETAKAAAGLLSIQTGCKLLTFGYMQQEVENHLDGGPWEFLSLIDNADYIMTDSFHATVFSLLFKKQFYVYDRQYVHKQTQASRIIDLLTRINLTNRYEPKEVNNSILDYSNVESVFVSDRNSYEIFISQVLKL